MIFVTMKGVSGLIRTRPLLCGYDIISRLQERQNETISAANSESRVDLSRFLQFVVRKRLESVWLIRLA